ncbi:MAG: DEAD/DEAH box helicase [Pseudomonadota bacterium]
MSLADYIESLKLFKDLAPDIVCHRVLPAKPARYGIPLSLKDSPARAVYARQGIERLYDHQERALDFIAQGRHTVIATATASGKSLTYNLPVLDAVIRDCKARALYLFPLKALARDQLDSLETLLADALPGHGCPLTARVYDGDLTAHEKKKIRTFPPNILMTNPEMLHLAMLAHHHLWQAFFSNLAYVVVDEVHTYRGVMGSHMAWVFRRLRRICSHYGADPVFIFCSATIGNPRELASELTGLDVEVVIGEGAPCGKKDVLLMNGMAGAAQTAIQLMHAAVYRGIRTIVYTQSRKITELIALWASQRAGHLGEKISAYRAGFLPEERREIERKLASGDLLAVVSTSALELGIDIGNLDLCILVGYPGTIMSTWQRTGRVGRQGEDSAMIFVAHEDALDYYFMNHPQALFEMPPEKAVINPFNRVIMERHLECAAGDQSLAATEPMMQIPVVRDVVESLEATARLLRSGDGDIWYAARKSPHREVSLRGTGRSVPILLSGTRKSLGDVDWFRAFYETHEGAVYLHHGQTYVVSVFDHEQGIVEVRPQDVHYYTRARSSKATEILDVEKSLNLWNTRVGFGRLKVTDQVTGYEKKLVATQKSLGVVPLELPEVTFETEGLWIEIPDRVRDAVETGQFHFMGGIHAMEHAAIGILPLVVMADRNDLGGISIPFHPQIGRAAVFIYDGTPGGIGLSRQAFLTMAAVLEKTFQAISSCPCESGCPVCVHSPKCGSGNRPIDKQAALAILEQLRPGGSPCPVAHDRSVRDTKQDHQVQDAPAPARLVAPLDGISSGRSMDSMSGAGDGRLIRFGVLDIETRRSAAEVGGWTRADLMGVSCAVLYDSGTDAFLDYSQDEIHRLEQDLGKLDLVIGFNILRFDYKVLSGLSGYDFLSLPTLDLLVNIHQTLGYRLSLDNLARASLNTSKSADGLMALAWWKQGCLDKIRDYCRQDVAVTRDLYRFGLENRYVLFTNKAGMAVRVPVSW